MEEEMEEAPQPASAMPPMMRAAALTMTGEFVLVIGLAFIMLGSAAFITGVLKIKGSGEVLVGLFLCGLALVLFTMSRSQIRPLAAPPKAPAANAKTGRKDESASYR